jgi:hypothetical protein
LDPERVPGTRLAGSLFGDPGLGNEGTSKVSAQGMKILIDRLQRAGLAPFQGQDPTEVRVRAKGVDLIIRQRDDGGFLVSDAAGGKVSRACPDERAVVEAIRRWR